MSRTDLCNKAVRLMRSPAKKKPHPILEPLLKELYSILLHRKTFMRKHGALRMYSAAQWT